MRSREAVLAVLLIGLMVFAGLQEPRFVSIQAQTLLASHLWELAIIAIPMLLIIISAGIDLSVGSMVALSAVTMGLAFEKGIPVFAASGLGIVVGGVAGALNGTLITRLKVHPLIVTLATMAAFRGIAEGISLARPISGYPADFLQLASGRVPLAGVLFAVFALAAGWVLKATRIGRHVVAIGTEEPVSRFSGIAVDRIKVWLYLASGLACGLAATILVARNNTAKADLGAGLELEAITAAVLGGASIEGGRGKVVGLVLGLALIHETREFVSWHWKQSELNLIVIGVLLIATVLVERILDRKDGKVRTS